MKNYFLLFVLLFSINLSFGQNPGGSDPFCPCCEDMIDENTGLPNPGLEADYIACTNECNAGNNPCVPIDTALFVLIILGASLGLYKVHQNKKRQLEN